MINVEIKEKVVMHVVAIVENTDSEDKIRIEFYENPEGLAAFDEDLMNIVRGKKNQYLFVDLDGRWFSYDSIDEAISKAKELLA